MPFTTVCPNCDARLTAPDTVRGKKVKCKKCDEPFVARPAAGADDDEDDRPVRPARAAAPKGKPRPVRDDDDDDDAPRRKSSRSRRPADDDADDEPRAKAKKKGKKKAQSSPVLLIVMIGVVILALGGAGAGIFFAFFYEEKDPETPVAKGDGPPPPPPGPGGPKGGPGAAVDTNRWIEQHDPDGRYRVKFPSTPERLTRPGPPGAGGDVVIYRVRDGAAGGLQVVHRILTAAEQGAGNEDQILDQFLNVAKLPAAVNATEKRDITYQSFKGKETVLTAPGKQGGAIVRVIIAGDRVISLIAAGENFTADSPRVRAFFESLKVE